MPLTKFKCPDGITRPISECLNKCPRPEGRCLSLPTLYEIGKSYPYTGKNSTTMLLPGTRLAYLKIKCDYAIDPLDSAFKLLGTRHHQKLDYAAKILGLQSEKPMDYEIKSILDLLEPDELNEGSFILYDYKCWGSYSVAKALGLKSDDGEADMRDTELQLNDYRWKIESLGLKISRIKVQSVVRDGGTWYAKKQGVVNKFEMIPVKRMDDLEVFYYFFDKDKALKDAIATNTLPPMCSFDERWGGNRCKKACEVMEFCPEGRAVNKLPKLE